MIPYYWKNLIKKSFEVELEYFKRMGKYEKANEKENKKMKNWIDILKIVLALTIMAIGLFGIGWFIGNLIAIQMECGG